MSIKWYEVYKEEYPKNLFLMALDPITNECIRVINENGYNKSIALRAMDRIKPKYKKILQFRYEDRMTYKTIGEMFGCCSQWGCYYEHKSRWLWKKEYLSLLFNIQNKFIKIALPELSEYKDTFLKLGATIVQDLVDLINIDGYALLMYNEDLTWDDLQKILSVLDDIGILYNDPIEPFLGYIKKSLYNECIDGKISNGYFGMPTISYYDKQITYITKGAYLVFTKGYYNRYYDKVVCHMTDDQIELIKNDLESFESQLIDRDLLQIDIL